MLSYPAAVVAAEAVVRASVPAPPDAQALAELRDAARTEGRREGYEAGMREARAEVQAQIDGLHALGAACRSALERGIEGVEEAAVEIAFAAAAKIVGDAAVAETGVRALVREALRRVATRGEIVVRVCAADFALLGGSAAQLGADAAQVSLVADARIAAGGCVIETGEGSLDARLETQLQSLLEALARARAAERPA
jgi:flagellar biosynthesis/type III secretory pathway protein FliH